MCQYNELDRETCPKLCRVSPVYGVTCMSYCIIFEHFIWRIWYYSAMFSKRPWLYLVLYWGSWLNRNQYNLSEPNARLVYGTTYAGFSLDKWQTVVDASAYNLGLVAVIFLSLHLSGAMNVTGGDYSKNQTYVEQQWMLYQRYLFIMCTFVIGPVILLGLFGNIIAFCTFGKMVPQNATTFLLRALAITDLCVLLSSSIYIYVKNIKLYGDSWVSTARLLHPYVTTYIIPCFSIPKLANVWITVIVGFHRYIVVCRPLQAAGLCTTSHARKQVICIILISTAFKLPGFFAFELRKNDGSTYDARLLLNNKWYFYIYEVGCVFAFTFVIPLGMLSFFLCAPDHVIAHRQTTTFGASK